MICCVNPIDFAGATYSLHPEVVQIQIEGGFSQGSCNTRFAAVRKRDSHVISFLLAAQPSGYAINVALEESDKYYGDRCVISLAYSDQT